jgi:hypothetical protein
MFAEMCLRVGRTLLRLGCRRVTGSGTDPIGYAKCAGKFVGCVAGVLASKVAHRNMQAGVAVVE